MGVCCVELLKSFPHFPICTEDPFTFAVIYCAHFFIHRLSRILIELQEDSDSEVRSEVRDSKEALSLDPVSAKMSSYNE